MDSEKRTPENENNPAQNELDLGFSQMEPITPKKVIKLEPSLFEKAKGLFAKKEQKNTENQFAGRKEPVFSSTGATGETSMRSENPSEKFSSEDSNENNYEPQISTANVTETTSESLTEPVATEGEETVKMVQSETPEFQAKPKAGFKNPENWAILSVLPQKHRRIFVALAGVVLLLIFILWMKPSSDTVQSYEQQSNNGVPIQFQQLDQSQTVEPTVLDNPAPQNDNATAQQQSETMPENANVATAAQQPIEQGAATSVAEQTAVENKTTEAISAETKPAIETVKSTESAKAQEATKPRPHHETAKKPEPATAAKNQPSKTQSAKTEKQVRDILEGKTTTTTATKAAAGSRTLTIPQGVTLMQVFRDNHLPVGDVNAMTKANGAGNALSSFKPGDKVRVSLNAQGRVSELRLANGARFTRQSDGSYQFKK